MTRLDPSKASQELELLLRKLWEVGLRTEVRPGEDSNLLIFVRASKKKRLRRALYQSRYVYKFRFYFINWSLMPVCPLESAIGSMAYVVLNPRMSPPPNHRRNPSDFAL